ncbi:CDP-glycerol glycerophosphotransferase family protein [Peribacillus simplex]|uniref:CDP-glycerol glycerophosphotransferase family protein n=1 Tax=Peribacillus simplex TaxID=1478 RepID=UPI003266C7C5
MFGENEVNDYHLLKYSLLYDFFVYFSSVKIYGLPLAQCLSRLFLLPHIQPFVDQNLGNQILMNEFHKQQKFQTMGAINQKLIAFENIAQVTIQKNKNSILLSDDYYAFAIDQLKEYEITLYGVHHKEIHDNLPHQFKSALFRNELLKVDNQMVKEQHAFLKKKIDEKLRFLPQHFYFSTPLFQQWLSKACITIIRWVYILDQQILKTRPAVIINPSEASIFGTILGLLSKKYQIPFINLPLTTIGDLNIIPSRADYYFVWGKHQKNWLMKRYISEDKITETGNIKFFYDKKNPSISKESFYEKLKIPSNHFILGFTTQPYLNTNDKLEKWIEAIPINLPVTILVKKHRNDKYEYPSLSTKKNVQILSSDYPLYDFLHHIDCLMTIASTTAFEAALLDKPLLILQPSIPYHYVLNHNQNNAYFAQSQAGEIIENATELIQAITKITTVPGYVDHLTKKVNTFRKGSIKTVHWAPALTKNKIKEIMMKHL